MQSSAITSDARQTLLSLAEGTIDPALRVSRGEISDEDISRLISWLASDEPFQTLPAWEVPTKCVDGRGRKDDNQQLGSNAAAGTFSLVVADALTHANYRHAGEHATEHARRLYAELIKQGYKVGGHDDDHAAAPACGCGAEDKLDNADASQPSILRYITRRATDIRQLLGSLGIVVDEQLQAAIVAKARQLIQEGYASGGAALRQAYVDVAGEAAIETLTGQHNEVALVVNTQPGTTLDRQAIRAKFGESYQAFNLDVPALRRAAELISLSPAEAQETFVAALYYNVATAAVLAGPSLRVVVH